jgi:hypothetical protein
MADRNTPPPVTPPPSKAEPRPAAGLWAALIIRSPDGPGWDVLAMPAQQAYAMPTKGSA